MTYDEWTKGRCEGSVLNLKGKNMKAWKLPISMAMMAISSGTHAVEPLGIALGGGIVIFPSIDMSVVDNDNVYLQPEENQESSTVTRVTPVIAVAIDRGRTKLGLGLEAEKGVYSSDENDNYVDTRINAAADFTMTARNALRLGAEYNRLHDPRGTGTVEGSRALEIEDPDVYSENVLDAAYTYGSENAFLNVTFGLNRYAKEHQNNLDVAATDNRDHVKNTISVDSAIYLSDRSNLLIDISTADIDYSKDNIITEGREGNLTTALLGASYDVTGKLNASAKLGIAKRYFDSSDVDTDSTASWEAGLTWNPKTYSTITIFTAQKSSETANVGNYINTEYSTVNWTHALSEYFSLGAGASFTRNQYYNEENNRADEVWAYDLTGTYSPFRKLDIYGSLRQTNRESSGTDLDYDQQVIALGISLAL